MVDLYLGLSSCELGLLSAEGLTSLKDRSGALPTYTSTFISHQRHLLAKLSLFRMVTELVFFCIDQDPFPCITNKIIKVCLEVEKPF